MVNNHGVTDVLANVFERIGLVQKRSHVSRRRHGSVFAQLCKDRSITQVTLFATDLRDVRHEILKTLRERKVAFLLHKELSVCTSTLC